MMGKKICFLLFTVLKLRMGSLSGATRDRLYSIVFILFLIKNKLYTIKNKLHLFKMDSTFVHREPTIQKNQNHQ